MKRAVWLVDPKLLIRALAAGAAAAAAFMLLGHYRPVLALHYGLFGCMMIAGTMGLLYARDVARGYRAGALGGGRRAPKTDCRQSEREGKRPDAASGRVWRTT